MTSGRLRNRLIASAIASRLASYSACEIVSMSFSAPGGKKFSTLNEVILSVPRG
jgi:hypothetical protein